MLQKREEETVMEAEAVIDLVIGLVGVEPKVLHGELQ